MVAARLTDITDRKLTIKLLKEAHAGEEVEVEVDLEALANKLAEISAAKSAANQPEPVAAEPRHKSARERLAEMGRLSMAHRLPPGTRIPTREEVLAAGLRSAGGRSSDELIDEIRGEW